MAGKRVKLHEQGLHNDIRYSGPMSFQAFQILGWSCIVITVILKLMSIATNVNPNDSQRFNAIAHVIEYIAELSLPFLLMANFARILNNSEGFKKQLLRNGGAMVGIFAVFMIFFYRYIVGTVGLLLTDRNDAYPLVMTCFYTVNGKGFFAINIFVDLFLCTLVMYFLNARPKKIFTGNRLWIFRAFTILPIGYEIASMLLKASAAQGQILLPTWVFPLLTVKPPMTFVVFVFLALHLKTRELRYCRKGKTHEDYQAFLKTNRNSWHFSVYAAVVTLIAGALDLLIAIFLIREQAMTSETFVVALGISDKAILDSVALAIGFGKSACLMIFAPFLLLFNYTRIPKNMMTSMLIPVVGIGLIAIICIQGIYQLVAIAPIPKLDVQALKDVLIKTFSVLTEV